MQQDQEKKSFEHKVANVISKQRLAIIIVALIIIAIIATVIIVNKVSASKYDSNMNKLYAVEQKLTNWSATDDSEEAIAEGKAIIDELDSISGASAKYPSQKATLDLAGIYYDKADYTKAIELLGKLTNDAKGTYLEQVAIINRAVAYEDNNQIDKAIEDYQRIWDNWAKESPYSPKALFGLARIYDGQNNSDLAKSTYEQLVDQFPQSEYAKVAQNRLALL